MGKVIVYEYMTLDGIMEAPEKWQFPYLSPDVAESIQSQISAADAILLGRVTYDIFAASWPIRTHNEFGVADKLNSVPKYVFSSTLEQPLWNHTTQVKEKVPEEIARLKHVYDGNLAILGSATLVQSLMSSGLIDEFQLMVYPIILGNGKLLFTEGNQLALKLVEVKKFSSGTLLLRYQPDVQ